MTISRRDALLQGCAIGVGVIAANVPGIVALAQPQPPLRRSLSGMALNDPILQAWRDGVRLLKARPATNSVSWANFAAIHGSANCFQSVPARQLVLPALAPGLSAHVRADGEATDRLQ